MPEGPEVLVISEQLHFYLSQKEISSIEFVSGKYSVSPPDNFELLVEELPLKVNRVFCKGKLIVFELFKDSKRWWIFNSLRMTGVWKLNNEESDENDHLRLKMEFLPRKENAGLDVCEISYIDVRGFGTFDITNDENEKDRRLDKLKSSFIGEYIIDYNTFHENIKKGKKSLLTSKLTDQKSVCSGIGNYLLSEILYESRINPFLKCNELSDNDIKSIYDNTLKIMKMSYELGGMSMSDYIDLSGVKGKFEKYLKVYRRKVDVYGNKVHSRKRGNGQTIWFVPGLQRKEYVDIVFEDSESE